MFYTSVNNLAVLMSAVSSMIIGFIWYSPMMFQKPWMKYSKLDAKKLRIIQKHQRKNYGISCVSAIITSYSIALLLNALLVVNIEEGMTLGLLLWGGLVAPVMLTSVLFQQMPWKLFWINSGYQLVSILLSSAILSVWI